MKIEQFQEKKKTAEYETMVIEMALAIIEKRAQLQIEEMASKEITSRIQTMYDTVKGEVLDFCNKQGITIDAKDNEESLISRVNNARYLRKRNRPRLDDEKIQAAESNVINMFTYANILGKNPVQEIMDNKRLPTYEEATQSGGSKLPTYEEAMAMQAPLPDPKLPGKKGLSIKGPQVG